MPLVLLGMSLPLGSLPGSHPAEAGLCAPPALGCLSLALITWALQNLSASQFSLTEKLPKGRSLIWAFLGLPVLPSTGPGPEASGTA